MVHKNLKVSEVYIQTFTKAFLPFKDLVLNERGFHFEAFALHFQGRNPTGVHGKAASGALQEVMNSPDTSGSTLERSHSNAVTATGECSKHCEFTVGLSQNWKE